MSLKARLENATATATDIAGTPWAVLGAVAIILTWALLGPAAGFNNTWQLTINTGTTIVTFVMGFAIIYAENRSSRAMQVKLDAQTKVIGAIAKHLGIDGEQCDVDAVLGLEDQDEDTIKKTQERIRS